MPRIVLSVSIKLLPFSETNPELWFSKAESQFKMKGITSDTTKLHHLYPLMTDKAANKIEAFLLNPPKTGKVDTMIDIWRTPRKSLVRSTRFGPRKQAKVTPIRWTPSLVDLRVEDTPRWSTRRTEASWRQDVLLP